VDWLVEVQESFELNHETLYTAVKMTDLFLSKKPAKKEDLQLIGATACLIAFKVMIILVLIKYDYRDDYLIDDYLIVLKRVFMLVPCQVDERIPPMVDDFLYVCDDAYS
jgi:cyclin B